MKTAAAFAPPTFVVPAVVVGVGAAVAVDIISLLSPPLSGVLVWSQEEASAMRDREEVKVVESKSKHPRSVENETDKYFTASLPFSSHGCALSSRDVTWIIIYYNHERQGALPMYIP